MKLTKITATYGTTISTGNFNNIRPEITLEVELDDNDRENMDETMGELMFTARYAVAESLIQPVTSAFNNNMHWYSNAKDIDDLRERMTISIEMFRWMNEHAEMTADDLVQDMWESVVIYNRDRAETEPTETTPSAPNLDEIPF